MAKRMLFVHDYRGSAQMRQYSYLSPLWLATIVIVPAPFSAIMLWAIVAGPLAIV